jgi:hypothetical protein
VTSTALSFGYRKYEDAMVQASLVALVVVLCVIVTRQLPIVSGDTQALANSASSLVECARKGIWTGCSGATQFGIVQYFPAMFLAWRGVNASAIVTVLALLNLLAFLFTLRIVFTFQKISHSARIFLVILFLSSPLMAYSVFSFGESLVTCLGVISVVSLCRHKNGVFLLATSLTVASRETAIFYVAPLVFAVFMTLPDKRRSDLLRVIVALLIGLMLLLSFNIFKFGKWTNVPHSDPALRVNDMGTSLKILLGIFFSPNGGIVWYWPVAFLLICSAVRRGWLFGLSKVSVQSVAPTLLVLVGITNQALGLSNWYAPFGWVAWGPRLMIPSLAMAVVVIVIISDSNRDAKRHQRRFRRRSTQLYVRFAFVALSGSSLVAALGFLNQPIRVLSWFGLPDETCPTPAIIQVDRGYYFRCLLHGMWRWDPSMYELSFSSFSGGFSALILGLFLFPAWRLSSRLFGQTVTDIEHSQEKEKYQHS